MANEKLGNETAASKFDGDTIKEGNRRSYLRSSQVQEIRKKEIPKCYDWAEGELNALQGAA